MDDNRIVELYFMRTEDAIMETERKYGAYCRSIAFYILNDEGASEEAVNDTYLRAWNAIPPTRPVSLRAYLGAVCRRVAYDKYHERKTSKRGGGQLPLVLDELAECLPDTQSDGICDQVALKEAVERFLRSLSQKQRTLFVLRYWYVIPTKEIAERLDMKEGNVRMHLLRIRKKFQKYLCEEDFFHEKA